MFGARNACAELYFGISKLLYDLYSKVRGKSRLSVAESSLLVTRYVCCFRCLKTVFGKENMLLEHLLL